MTGLSKITDKILDEAKKDAEARLAEADAECARMKESFRKRRDIACSLLSEIPGITFVRPTGAFYIFADISSFGMSSTEFCDQLMEKAHIAAAPGCGFGADKFVRFSYACSEETLYKAFASLKAFCATLAK